MKPLVHILCALTSICATASASIIFQEPFDYPEGDLAGNLNDGIAWVANTGAEGNSVSATSLVPAGPPDFVTSGGQASQPTDNARASLALSTAASDQIGVDETTIYISFLQQFDAGDIKSRIIEFWRGTPVANNTIFSYGIDTNGTAPDYGLLLDKNAAGARAIDVGDPDVIGADTHLVVFRIDYGVNDADAISVFVDPGVTEPAVADGTDTYNNLAFNRVGFGSFQGGSMNLDEIRIGTTYLDVVRTRRDTDNDGMDDGWELDNGLVVGIDDSALDEDPNTPTNGDGLSNLDEFLNDTDPNDPDSDDDGLEDGVEVSADPSVNSLNPYQTSNSGDAATTAPGLKTDPNDADSDDDGLTDGEELSADNGSITNPNAMDTDGDNLLDEFEIVGGLDPTDSTGINGEFGNADTDFLLNTDEQTAGTDPTNGDTDDDGYLDHVETGGGTWIDEDETGSDPLDDDTDDDGLKDGVENLDSGSPTGPVYNSDPNLADTDSDGFSDRTEVIFGNSDPNNAGDVPSFAPVVASVQFDFADPDSNRSTGLYAPAGTIDTPAHADGSLGDADSSFNSTFDNAFGSFRDSQGIEVPGVSIDIGKDSGGDLNFDFSAALETSGINLTGNNTTIYDNELWTDRLFSRNDDNIVIRVNGLAAGSYRVNALAFQAETPDRTYNVSFGTQVADASQPPVFGAEHVGIGGAPDTFVENQSYFTEDITITDNQYIVVLVDPTNSAFGNVEGLQIFPVPPTPSSLRVTQTAFNGAAFDLTVTGFDITKSYVLKRSESLVDGFTTTIGAPFTPATEEETVSDPAPAGDEGFYRVEEAP